MHYRAPKPLDVDCLRCSNELLSVMPWRVLSTPSLELPRLLGAEHKIGYSRAPGL